MAGWRLGLYLSSPLYMIRATITAHKAKHIVCFADDDDGEGLSRGDVSESEHIVMGYLLI